MAYILLVYERIKSNGSDVAVKIIQENQNKYEIITENEDSFYVFLMEIVLVVIKMIIRRV